MNLLIYTTEVTFVAAYAMKSNVGLGICLCPFLTSELDGGKLSASVPGLFTMGKELKLPIDWEAA
jgi:hypothetical protein